MQRHQLALSPPTFNLQTKTIMEPKTQKEFCHSCQAVLDSRLELSKNINIFSGHSGYFAAKKIFVSYFLELPNSLMFAPIEEERFLDSFKREFKEHIIKEFGDKSYFNKKKEQLNDLLFILKEKIILHVERKEVRILCVNPEGELVQKMRNFILQFYIKKKKKSEICVITSGGAFLSTRKIQFKKPKIDFQDNYCDDILVMHEQVTGLLKKKHESGLFLFHGKPGTGKSTYLRYLIKTIKKKTIFISPKMAGNLDNIEIIKLLLDNKNCLLVIEDAEELVVSRNHERNSSLSTILNLTDGILGESLGIQIIATFNTDLKNIDSALMRKGRLKMVYEFPALSAQKASNLLQKQGIDVAVQEPITLAEVYNYDVSNGTAGVTKRALGFVQ